MTRLSLEARIISLVADAALYACEVSPTHCKCPGCLRARTVGANLNRLESTTITEVGR